MAIGLPPHISRGLKYSAVLIACAATGGWQLAPMRQLRPALPNGAVNAENFDAKEPNEGVYVPESELAMERLALAQKMERLKEWNKSADLYQEILTDPKYASKVVPSKEDADHKLYQYSSVEELVMQRLAHWPQEGLEVYRARYETPAAALLESAHDRNDLSALHQVLSHYFVTDAGKNAGIRLIDHYLEGGEFRAAASIADRLLQWHPNVAAERGQVLYRAALAYHLAGDEGEARQRLAELKQHDPQARGLVRGKEVLLADSLATELHDPPPTATGQSADSYTTFGGDPTRDRILAVSGTPGAHLYSIALSRPTIANGPPAQMIEARYREDVKRGQTLGVMPVVDRGQLFFQDGQRVYAVNIESGVPLPGWLQTHGAEHDGAYTLGGVTASPRTHQLTLTLTDRQVLAVMGQQDASLARFGIPQQGEPRLVCLDRESGRENWVVAPSQLKLETLRQVQFGGSPVVAGDNVLIVGTAGRQAGFENCYVLCFNLANGALRWSCEVAEASTVAAAWAGFNPNFPLPQNESHLAYANGRVYVQTNRGAVAAVDAYNGTIAWLDIYPRGQQGINPAVNPMMFQGGAQFQQNPTKPWSFNPVIVSQGMVFTLPLEGKNLLIYDAATGAQVKRIDLGELAQRVKSADVVESDDFTTLVGVSGEKLALAASKTIVVLNWKTFDAEKFKDDMFSWIEGTAFEIRGRPLMTDRSIYVAAEDRLSRLDLKSGLIKDVHPDYPRTWDDSEGPGNVLVTSDHTIVAGAERVDVYTDLGVAKAKLDREVAEAPNDPQPRLRYAEVMYAAGDYDTSLAKLDEAIERLGGPDAMTPGAARDRVFNDALTFAQKLKGDDRPQARQRVERLFDRAAQAALAPQQQVSYRMARGGFDEGKQDLAGAVKLYQQVLSDPQMRSVPLPDEVSKAPASADVVARKQIAQLIRRDPSVYEPFEREAAASLQSATEANAPAKLLAVAQTYPNSTVAPRAMLLAASAYEAAGDLRAARHVLLDIYFNHDAAGGSERSQILEALARTDPRTAAHMLGEGVSQLNDPVLRQALKLNDGTEIAAGTKFSAALDKVRRAAYQEQARGLPTFHLPFPQRPPNGPYPKPFQPESPVIANVDELVLPLREFGRTDRIVTWSSAPLLSVYPAGATKPVASTPQVPEPPRGCAWIGGKDLLVWTGKQLTMLKGDGPDTAWTLDVSRLPAMDVIAVADTSGGGAEGPQPAPNNFAQNRVFLNRGGRIIVRNGLVQQVQPAGAAAPGGVKPAPAGPEQIDQVVPAPQRIAISTSSGRVLSVDTTGGRIAWQTRLTDRALDRLLSNDDFTIVLGGDELNVRMAVLDTFTGHVRGTRTFSRASNSFPQNVALSPDGTLVYTLPDRLCLKDLYKPWEDKGIEKMTAPGQTTFFGLSGPDQLLISEGRIVALTDTGTTDRAGEKYVRLYSLETGEPIMLNFGEGQQVERALSAGTKSADTLLRMIGPRLYVISADACNTYNLDHPDEHESLYGEELPLTPISAAYVGTDFRLFVGEDPDAVGPAPAPAAPAAGPAQAGANAPAQPAPAAPPPPRISCELYAFGRYQTNHGESGRLDYQVKIADPSGVMPAWQPFDGGICYLSADHKLHILMGAKP